jgi:hypothetical protein
MENLDSSASLLSLPTSNGTEQQTAATPVANGSQPSLPATTPLLGTDQLTPQLNKQAYVNPYPTSSSTGYPPMNYNYQASYAQGGYGTNPQGYSSLGMNPYGTTASGTPSTYPHSAYPQTTAQQQQQGATSTTQTNTTSPSQLSTHNYGGYPYSSSAANYAQANYPISSQYAQTSAHMNSHVNYQPMQPQPSAYQPPSGQSLMTQMNNNQGLALPKATTPRAGPTKRRRASEDTTPKPVKPTPTVNDSDNWERGQYQPTVRKRAKTKYADDEDDDEDIDDDIEEDDDEMLQRTERKSLRERKPSKKGEKEKKSPSTSTATSPRVTPKKKETKVEEEEEVEEEQGNLEVELEFPEDSLLETDEETHTKKYSKIIFNGNPYVIGDTIAFWPEGKKGRPPMGTIKSFSTDGENNTVDCCWFYRVEETNLKGKRRQKIGPREVFLSEHTDPNACESIWKKVSIKSKYEVPDLEEYVKEPDCYYYSSKFNHLELTFEDL